jgi:hypothetical protein
MDRNIYFIDIDLADDLDEIIRINNIGYINPCQYLIREKNDIHAKINETYLVHRLSSDIVRFDNTIVIVGDYDIETMINYIDNDVMLKIDELVNIKYRMIYKVVRDDSGLISFRYANLLT